MISPIKKGKNHGDERNTAPEKIARWKVMVTGLQPVLGELPRLVPLHTDLDRVIHESETLDARNEALKAENREVVSTREALAKTGDDLRRRLGAALQTTYGFRSEKLIEFGIQPRRTRGRDKKARARRQQTEAKPAVTLTEPIQ